MKKGRILIVEDEIIISMELQDKLTSLGYQVTAAVCSSDDAIAKAGEDRPDLILMDIRIQGDRDGIETAKIIRSRFDIPVVFSTAYLDKERIERAKLTMPFGYLLKPIQDKDLKVTLEMALYVAGVDRERKQVESRLEESEELFRALFEQAGGYCMILKPTESGIPEILNANRAACQAHGYTRDEMIGRPVSDLDDEQGKRLCRERTQVILSEEPFVIENYHIRKDGSSFPVAVCANAVRFKNRPPLILTTEFDISDLKRADHTLIESERRLRETLDTMEMAITTYEPVNGGENFQLIDLNRFGEKLIRSSREEVLGKTVTELFSEEPFTFLLEKLQETWRTGKSMRIPLKNNGGDQHPPDGESYLYKLPSGQVVAMFENTTETKATDA